MPLPLSETSHEHPQGTLWLVGPLVLPALAPLAAPVHTARHCELMEG